MELLVGPQQVRLVVVLEHLVVELVATLISKVILVAAVVAGIQLLNKTVHL